MLIALLGAECTGKTALARALSERCSDRWKVRSTWVPEELRAWCDTHGRTPGPEEQSHIAAAQTRRIRQALRTAELVVADTTALMTALYSQWYFGDASLREEALAFQRSCHLTLLTLPDLPWEADGLQRDGPRVQQGVSALLQEWLSAAKLPHRTVGGQGEARLEQAWQACCDARQAGLGSA